MIAAAQDARLSPLAAPVLLAVLCERRSVRAIGEAVGWSAGVVLCALRELRRAGFVDWSDGEHGSIRPLVEFARQGGPTSSGRAQGRHVPGDVMGEKVVW